MNIELNDAVFELISRAANNTGLSSFVIGGYVRDKLLQRNSKDIDILVIGSGIELATEVARLSGQEKTLAVFKNFGTAMIRYKDLELEFVGARKESYRADSRKPLVEDGTFEDDIARRDFTINTLAIDLSDRGTLIDRYNGLQDLNNGILRTPLDPGQTFSDDPLRMMRGIRFAAQLDFKLELQTLNAISEHADRIKIISYERIRDELNKIIQSARPSIGFKHLFNTGLLSIIFPEMAALYGVDTINGKSHKDNFYHTLEVLDNVSSVSDNIWLRWAAILHDIAKPLTKRFDPEIGWTFHGHEDKGARIVSRIFKMFHLPLNENMRFVEKLVLLHLRPIVLAKETVSDSAVRRLLFEAGDDIDELMLLCHADITTKNEYKAKKYRDNFELVKSKIVDVEKRDNIRNWQPPVNGNDIMEVFHISAGPEIGILKNFIREAILEGEISNNREFALKLLYKKGKEMGLTLYI